MKAVIMAGGQGTRFWPLSRRGRPKQFLNLVGQRTLLQQTAHRLLDRLASQDLYVACTSRYLDQVLQQLPGLERHRVIVEPQGRNTAPCSGLAALHLREHFPDEVMAMFPSDHLIQDEVEFHSALDAAEELAREDWLVAFGIRPDFASTGYGYLRRGEKLGKWAGRDAYRVEQFVEKPDEERARTYLETGGYDWNSGMFVWKVETILSATKAHFPELGQGLEAIERGGFSEQAVKDVFKRIPSISVDYAVMEKADRVAEIPCDPGWSDLGSWRALAALQPADPKGLFANGPLVAVDSREVFVRTQEGKLTALVGVEGLVLVDTPDALLVCAAQRSEDIKEIVGQLRSQGKTKWL